MVNESYFRFDDDKTAHVLLQSSSDKWVIGEHLALYIYIYHEI